VEFTGFDGEAFGVGIDSFSGFRIEHQDFPESPFECRSEGAERFALTFRCRGGIKRAG